MTVAPPFFLFVFLVLPISLVLLGCSTGLVIGYLGSRFPGLKVHRPVRSIFLAILVSFPLVAAVLVLQFLVSLIPEHTDFSVPYAFVLYLASFGVFFFRVEAASRETKVLFSIAILATVPSVFFELGKYFLNLLLATI
ncbi:MAG: hypothetical protein RR855_06155 [Comamonas sp.]